jgi:predicted RNA-binding Zn ribbon-like protein
MIGIPVKLLYEAKHHIVTVEMKTGELYRGYLADAEVWILNNNLGHDECTIGWCDNVCTWWSFDADIASIFAWCSNTFCDSSINV